MKNKTLNVILNLTYSTILILKIYSITYYAVNTDLFKINHIKIKGNKFIQDNEILNLIDANKYNILNVDKNKIKQKIKKNIYISDVKIYTKIPNQIILEIQEITPIALTQIDNKYYFIDNYSKLILANIESINFFSAPIITNSSNENINFKESNELLTSIFNYKNNLYNKLNEIIYKNDYIILVFTNNTKVQLRKNKYKNDVNKLYAFFNQIELNEIEHYKYVDLTINKQIIVIENEELVINENEIEL